MLNEIGSVTKVPEFIKKVKSGEAGNRLMGFGHRVYKSYDPRAKVIKRIADIVFTVTGKNPLLEIALELERIALQDDYFVTRKLYPERRLLLGLIYQAMGFPSRCSRCSSPSRAPPAGSRSGKRCCSIRAEDRNGRGRSIRAAQRDYVPREKRADRRSLALVALSRSRRCPGEVRLGRGVGAPAPAGRDRSAPVRIGDRADPELHQGQCRRG
jgi:citrate synthase